MDTYCYHCGYYQRPVTGKMTLAEVNDYRDGCDWQPLDYLGQPTVKIDCDNCGWVEVVEGRSTCWACEQPCAAQD